jgi:hypothetical protein
MYNEPNFTHLYQLKTFICAGLIYDWELFTENCLFFLGGGGGKGLTTSDGQEEETRDHF